MTTWAFAIKSGEIARALKNVCRHTEAYWSLIGPKMNALYEASDFHTYSSFAEGFCMLTIEAYRANKPATAAKAPPFTELTQEDVTGLFMHTCKTDYIDINDIMKAQIFRNHIDDLADNTVTQLVVTSYAARWLLTSPS